MSGAWEDQDDKNISIDITLSSRTKKLGNETFLSGLDYTNKLRDIYTTFYQPSWTSVNIEQSALSKLFSTSKSILSDKTVSLQAKNIEITQLPHANSQSYSKSVITTSHFQDNLLILTGKDKRLRIFEIDDNKLQSSVCFKDLPITNSQLYNNSVYVSGSRPYYYIYNINNQSSHRIPYINGYTGLPLGKMKISPDNKSVVFLGNNGKIMVVSTQSNKLLYELKMNSKGNGVCFTDDHTLICGGDDGDIYIWDLNMRRCIRRFSDEGTIKITCMESSGNLLAVGSNTGVVNLYDTNAQEFSGDEPKPIKSVMNLTTSVEGVVFNPTSEVLAIYSKWKANAVKLLHTPSMTVFANWPSFKDHLKFPMTCAFNSTSELLTIGNDEGVALLYKLNHYA